ncbi:hypothetical protein S245_063426, partial [Arachis hypogaea]
GLLQYLTKYRKKFGFGFVTSTNRTFRNKYWRRCRFISSTSVSAICQRPGAPSLTARSPGGSSLTLTLVIPLQ